MKDDLSLDDLVEVLSAQPALTLVGGSSNFHFRGSRFLHFHRGDEGVHADVRLGKTWEEHPLNTPLERLTLLALVLDHLEGHRSGVDRRNPRR